jgi:flagella basal body P-ring formation protein FlgA
MNKIILILIFAFAINLTYGKSSFSADRIENSCKDFLTSKLKNEIKIEFLNKVVDIELEEDGLEAYFELKGPEIGISTLNIYFFKGDKDVRKIGIPIKIYQSQKVPVAKSNLKLGDEVNESNVKFENKMVDFYVQFDEQFFIGSLTKRAFQPGDILNQEYLEFPPVIKKGDVIKVNVQTSSVMITTTGKALADAKIGDYINVQRDGAKKIINGVALPNGTILVSKY